MAAATIKPETKVYRPGTAGERIIRHLEGLGQATPTRHEIAEATDSTYYLVSVYLDRVRTYEGVPQVLANRADRILTTRAARTSQNGSGKAAESAKAKQSPKAKQSAPAGLPKPKEAYEQCKAMIEEGKQYPSDALVARANEYAKRTRKREFTPQSEL